MYNQTIAGVATMVGKSGINIIRLSGDKSLEILNKIFKCRGISKITEKHDHLMCYGHLIKNNKKIDEIMAVYMKAPRSYTAEDVVELHVHGGIMSVKMALELVYTFGARAAESGEFTKRAFLNGRLDLSQAEAIMSLISSKTEKAMSLSMNQLEGKLSKMVIDAQNIIKRLLAEIEVHIDYPEDDIDTSKKVIDSNLNKVILEIEDMILKSKQGKIYVNGLKMAFLGRTNVGKSSLMNALLKEERAIVTDIPGTTRDTIEAFLHIGNIPVKLVDTAGVRESIDVVEKIGIQKTLNEVEAADVVLVVLDVSKELNDEDKNLIEKIENKEHVIVLNKTDLEKKYDKEYIDKLYPNRVILETSAFNKAGIDALECALEKLFIEEVSLDDEALIFEERHIGVIKRALNELKEAKNGMINNMPLDCIEVDLYDAYQTLGEITGSTVKEDIIDLIFSEFCVGK